MNNPLNSYYLSYEITALPTVLFAQLVRGDEPLEFSSFEIPEEMYGTPIECRFSLYKEDGSLVEMSSNMYPGYPSTLAAACNLIPLRMIKKLLQDITKDSQKD